VVLHRLEEPSEARLSEAGAIGAIAQDREAELGIDSLKGIAGIDHDEPLEGLKVVVRELLEGLDPLSDEPSEDRVRQVLERLGRTAKDDHCGWPQDGC
jgi:hypothetical protein